MPTKLDYNLDLASTSRWNMISPTTTAKASLIYAQEIGDFWAGPNYYTSRESYSSYLLKVTVSGRGELDYNGQHYFLTPGQFFWIDCQKPQHYRTAHGSDDWHIFWVHFCGGNAKAYYDAFLTHNNGSVVGFLPNQSRAMNLFDSLLELDPVSPNQMQTDFIAANLLTQLISECVLATMPTGDSGDMPQIIQQVRQFLQASSREKHTLEALGEQFNINPQYLQKQFKRYMGMSPSDYLNFLRMTKAKELLRSTNMSIGDIALSVGIDNFGYFTRLFKQQENMTPKAYRSLWPTLETAVMHRFHGVNEEDINQG